MARDCRRQQQNCRFNHEQQLDILLLSEYTNEQERRIRKRGKMRLDETFDRNMKLTLAYVHIVVIFRHSNAYHEIWFGSY